MYCSTSSIGILLLVYNPKYITFYFLMDNLNFVIWYEI